MHFSDVISNAVSRTHCLEDLCTQLARFRVSPATDLLNMQLGSSPVNEEIFAALLQVHSSLLELDAPIIHSLLVLHQQSSNGALLLEIARLLVRALQDPRVLSKDTIAEVGSITFRASPSFILFALCHPNSNATIVQHQQAIFLQAEAVEKKHSSWLTVIGKCMTTKPKLQCLYAPHLF